MIPGHREIKNNPGYAYLDDFESTKTGVDLRYPFYWRLATTLRRPYQKSIVSELRCRIISIMAKSCAILLVSIDNSVFNRNNSTTPEHIRRNPDLQSNHLTRAVREQEIFFLNRSSLAGQSSYLPVLNVSFYPQERGPYNLDVTGLATDGSLANPTKRWGGMMRKLETTDFETANIEYIEFLVDGPICERYVGTNSGGDLYFNLGDISRRYFERWQKIL